MSRRKQYYRAYVKNFSTSLKFIRQKREFDLVLISSPKSKGWILDAICREIAAYWPGGNTTIYYGEGPLPKGRVYFMSHFSLIRKYLRPHPELHFAKVFSFYTHPNEDNLGMTNKEMIFWLNCVDLNVFQAKFFQKKRIQMGLKKKRIATVYGGADPNFIRGHTRTADGYVGFSSAYYDRKNPELIFNIIKSMPHRKFLLLGKKWEEYEKFEEMMAMNNFTYVETEYKNYPDYYDKMSVFVSASMLEGGPIPLIEAMTANIVPVASKTGFAPDIIKDGENGFVFPKTSDVQIVVGLIDKAFEIKTDIRESVKDYTWQKFSENIYKLSVK